MTNTEPGKTLDESPRAEWNIKARLAYSFSSAQKKEKPSKGTFSYAIPFYNVFLLITCSMFVHVIYFISLVKNRFASKF